MQALASTAVHAASDKLLHRVPAAAKRLDISTSQAYNLINRGELEVVRLGKSVRVPERVLQEIAHGKREGSGSL
jgi:excisionase family DNA binding protein